MQSSIPVFKIVELDPREAYLATGDYVCINASRTGEVRGFIGSPAEGIIVLFADDPSHPVNVWFDDVLLFERVFRTEAEYNQWQDLKSGKLQFRLPLC